MTQDVLAPARAARGAAIGGATSRRAAVEVAIVDVAVGGLALRGPCGPCGPRGVDGRSGQEHDPRYILGAAVGRPRVT